MILLGTRAMDNHVPFFFFFLIIKKLEIEKDQLLLFYLNVTIVAPTHGKLFRRETADVLLRPAKS
jgi:hypothetical protein